MMSAIAPPIPHSAAHGDSNYNHLELLLAVSNLSRESVSPLPPLPQQEAEWNRLLALAECHAVTPHLYSYIKSLPAGAVPQAVVLSLKNRGTEGALHNLLLASELLNISRHLRSCGIEHLAYKGPVLAVTLYGELDRRLSSDIDFVISKHRLPQACKALADLGFLEKSKLSPSQLAAAFRFGFEHTFTRGGLDVDLHWHVVPQFVSPSLDEEGVWNRVIQVPFFGQTIPTFCPEDLLVALCLHASGHEWASLALFCDIALLVRTSPLNWDIVSRHLRDSNTRRVVFVSLYLASKNWNVPLPSEISAQIAADREVPRIANTVENVLWPSGSEHADDEAPLRWLLQRTRGENLHDRIRYAAGVVLGPTLIDYQTFNLPGALIALYPALRAARLGLRYGSRILPEWLKS